MFWGVLGAIVAAVLLFSTRGRTASASQAPGYRSADDVIAELTAKQQGAVVIADPSISTASSVTSRPWARVIIIQQANPSPAQLIDLAAYIAKMPALSNIKYLQWVSGGHGSWTSNSLDVSSINAIASIKNMSPEQWLSTYMFGANAPAAGNNASPVLATTPSIDQGSGSQAAIQAAGITSPSTIAANSGVVAAPTVIQRFVSGEAISDGQLRDADPIMWQQFSNALGSALADWARNNNIDLAQVGWDQSVKVQVMAFTDQFKRNYYAMVV